MAQGILESRRQLKLLFRNAALLSHPPSGGGLKCLTDLLARPLDSGMLIDCLKVLLRKVQKEENFPF